MNPRIAIIGGGASGALAVIALSDQLGSKVELTVFEPAKELGAGLAYKSESPVHILNVPSEKMSAREAKPHEFTVWLDRFAPETAGQTFVPRFYFKRYLQWALASCSFEHIPQRAIQVRRGSEGWRLTGANGQEHKFEFVLVACGYQPPLLDVGDLLRTRSLAIVGTGLTAIDIWRDLRHRGYQGEIHFVSRRGVFPLPHQATTPVHLPALAGYSPSAILKLVRALNNVRWPAVADALRAQASAIWMAWSEAERGRFTRHLESYWKVIRHRIPPEIAAELAADKRIWITKGRVKPGENVAGAECTVFATGAPVAKGPSGEGLHLIGPSSRGLYFEITAIPEIRRQVAGIAEMIATDYLRDRGLRFGLSNASREYVFESLKNNIRK